MTKRFSITIMRASHLPTVIVVTLSLVSIGLYPSRLQAEDARDRLSRLGPRSIIADSEPYGRLLKRKLFVTRDEVARYLFLTNGRDDGDRSVALYRAGGKKGPFQGSYWITATEASTSLLACIPYEGQEEPYVDPKTVIVQRHDAAVPASTAQAVHELWLAMLERSQPGNDISISPTGVFSATNASGTRLRAIRTWLEDKSIGRAMMVLGEGLIDYPKLPPGDRAKLAHVIESESKRLLERVKKVPH